MSEDLLRHEKLFIGGEWVAPTDGEVIASINPSTGKEWATAAYAGTGDIDRAVTAANEAFRGPLMGLEAAVDALDFERALTQLAELERAALGTAPA